jgi:hypothetical protein
MSKCIISIIHFLLFNGSKFIIQHFEMSGMLRKDFGASSQYDLLALKRAIWGYAELIPILKSWIELF